MPGAFDVEEFWEDLLSFIEEKRVIPVVGAELLDIQEHGVSVPLYRTVAERLLDKYRQVLPLPPPNLRYGHEINDAVCLLAEGGKRPRDLYRPIHDILQTLLEGRAPPESLRQIALIQHFDLFVTTTPDDLLARALDAVRFSGNQGTDQIEYAPKLPTARLRDFAQRPSSNYTAVFYLFGKSDVAPFYAIHDEDALEFPYSLQAGDGPREVFAQLRNRNLLLIGCNFADWLGRLFIRLSNSDRLFSDQRTKREFLVGTETPKERDFIVFLEHFSQDSRCYPIDAREFVSELYRRWSKRNPSRSHSAQMPIQKLAEQTGDIFISYAHEDLPSARKLFEEVKELGSDVVWFDKTALRPGDEFDPCISAAIQRCSLFLALISASTEQRNEGYFRHEWSEAALRADRIAGRKFIFPIVIDPTAAAGGYNLMPACFKSLQFSYAPAGRLSAALKNELREQLRSLQRTRAL